MKPCVNRFECAAFAAVIVLLLTGCATMTPAPPPPRQQPQVLAPKAAAEVPVVSSQPPQVHVQPPQVNQDAARRALLEADFDFARASEDKGAADAFYDFLDENALLLPEGELPITGRDAIRVRQAAEPQGLLTWRPHESQVSASGDLGYTWGAYEFREKNAEGRAQIRYGKYLCVWKKEPDGAWKVMVRSSNPSPPPSERR
jgi:ketosteroid isomerase-like protein